MGACLSSSTGITSPGAGVFAAFEPCAHVQGVVRTGLDAEPAEHATAYVYVEDVDAVALALLDVNAARVRDDLDDSQGAVLGAACATCTPGLQAT